MRGGSWSETPHVKLGPLKGYRLSERGPRKIYPPGKEDCKFSVLAQAVRGEHVESIKLPRECIICPSSGFGRQIPTIFVVWEAQRVLV